MGGSDPRRARDAERANRGRSRCVSVNVYELGLSYGFEIDDDANVSIERTLTVMSDNYFYR
jgi:hypothetical protein